MGSGGGGGGAGGTKTLGKTTIGANSSQSRIHRGSGQLVAPSGGMTVNGGKWYGTLPTGRTLKFSVMNSTGYTQVGSCSDTTNGDDTTKWHSIIFSTGIALTGGTVYRINYYIGGSGTEPTYYWDEGCSGCSYSTNYSATCGTHVMSLNSTRNASFYVEE